MDVPAERVLAELSVLLMDALADEVPADESLVTRLLAEIGNCDTATLNVYSWRTRRARVLLWPESHLNRRMEERTAQVGMTHPLIRHYVHHHELLVLQPEDVDPAWSGSPVARLLQEEMNLNHHAAVPVSRRHGTLTSYALGRESGPLADDDLGRLRRTQALLQAYERARLRRLGDVDALVDPWETVTARPPALTARENEVLQRLASGAARRTVARELGVSPRTIDKHVERANAKLGTQSLIQALAVLHSRAPGTQFCVRRELEIHD